MKKIIPVSHINLTFRNVTAGVLSGLLCFGAAYVPMYAEEVKTLVCTKEQHTHDESCYEKVLICTDESEEHEHAGSCYEQKLVCTKEEHTHTDDCWKTEVVEDPKDEDKDTPAGDDSREEDKPDDKTEDKTDPSGDNTDKDKDKEEEEVDPDKDDVFCGKTAHKHSSSCYTDGKLTCKKEEHEHTLTCFSDSTADLEDASDWKASVRDVKITGDYRTDLVNIAISQLGTKESTKNYQVLADGETMKGYSRYGAWYGSPYGDWCAMFVSFCLNYAQIPTEDFCRDANCTSWVNRLKESGQYHSASSYTPKAGDIIFFDYYHTGNSNHVGIVEKVDFDENGNVKKIHCIEGNVHYEGGTDFVSRTSYSPSDSKLLGYGCLVEPVLPIFGKDGTAYKNYINEMVSEVVNVPLIRQNMLALIH